MIPLLQSVRALFRRHSHDDLAEEQRIYDRRMKEIQRLESRNRLAFANSRLDYLQSHGKPYYKPNGNGGTDSGARHEHQSSRPVTIYEPAYRTDEATGYPFVPVLESWQHKLKSGERFEQDPLFGWGVGNLGFGFTI